MKKWFVCVSGYSASGSSAAVDLLKEFDGFFECSAEIRIIQDPYGITQLERALIDDWNEISTPSAITDFLWLCKKCAKKGGGKNPFAPCGLSYSRKINKHFYDIAVEYVERLSEYKFKSDYYCQKFKKNYFKYVWDRMCLGIEIKSKRKIKLTTKRKYSYFSHPSRERFETETKAFFNSLFSSYFENGYSHIVLDQAVSVNKPETAFRYFENGKLIIVDRDPRDMFVDDIVNWGNFPDGDVDLLEAGRRFVIRHKAMRPNRLEHDDVLYLKFEELVLNYDETVAQIIRFLELDNSFHIKKKLYFDPNVSSKNIGIWKKYYGDFKEALDLISEELSAYCFEG